MPRTVESTVYRFDELSDQAKECARQWWRDLEAQDFDAEYVLEDAATCGDILGIDLRTRAAKLMGGGTRMEPCIYYSGFWSQGDGACFEGSYQYVKGAAKKIRQHAPDDKELHRIADELQALQRRHFYHITANMRHRGHYSHSGCMVVEVDAGDPLPDDDCESIVQLMRDFADWIYRRLESEYEWRMADEQVDDAIRANEYEFDESGHIA